MRHTLLFLAVALLACFLTSVSAARPAVFENLTPEKAIEKANAEGKVVVMDFTATWCGPCKTMDRITWSNRSVVEWLREHTVPIQVDVDRQQDVARKYNIRAMPTVVVLREGKVASRTVGLKNAEDFLRSMKKFERTDAPAPAVEAEVSEDNSGESVALDDDKDAGRDASADVDRRMQNASNMLAMRRYPEATTEYLWLWENMIRIEPALVGVRHVGLASEMRTLASSHPRAKIEFTKLRDVLTPELRERPIEPAQLNDWLTLSDVIGDEESVLAFVDAVRDEPNIAPMLATAEIRLTPLLVARGRWADAGKILDPDHCLAQLQGAWKFLGASAHTDAASHLLANAATQYAALLAAERDDAAATFASGVIELAGSPRAQVAMIEKAIEAKSPRPEHRDWLDAASRGGADVRALRQSLDRALSNAKRR